MPFEDRIDAGERLARVLQGFKKDRPVIVALPRGGVLVAAEVARALDAPIELLIVRKIGVPRHAELAMGSIVDGNPPITLRNEDVIAMMGVTEAEFDGVRERELNEIIRRRQRYLGDRRASLPMRGRTVILVDDGIATGATIRVAIKALRLRQPHRIVVAVPVSDTSVIAALRGEADAVICLEAHDRLDAVGAYYRDFSQVEDEEVLRAMASMMAHQQ
jgi:putative phosphoribosyl transferase